MQPSRYTLEEVLPHRAPMILIDRIEGVDLEHKRLEASVVAKEKWSASHVAIEFMAQTAAALAGYAEKEAAAREGRAESGARPGFLLGTRKLTLAIDRFEPGKKYLITAENIFGDDEAGSFSCSVRDESGREAASAILNAYRPRNIEDFMKGLQQ